MQLSMQWNDGWLWESQAHPSGTELAKSHPPVIIIPSRAAETKETGRHPSYSFPKSRKKPKPLANTTPKSCED